MVPARAITMFQGGKASVRFAFMTFLVIHTMNNRKHHHRLLRLGAADPPEGSLFLTRSSAWPRRASGIGHSPPAVRPF